MSKMLLRQVSNGESKAVTKRLSSLFSELIFDVVSKQSKAIVLSYPVHRGPCCTLMENAIIWEQHEENVN